MSAKPPVAPNRPWVKPEARNVGQPLLRQLLIKAFPGWANRRQTETKAVKPGSWEVCDYTRVLMRLPVFLQTGTVASLERPCPSSSAMWPRADVVKNGISRLGTRINCLSSSPTYFWSLSVTRLKFPYLHVFQLLLNSSCMRRRHISSAVSVRQANQCVPMQIFQKTEKEKAWRAFPSEWASLWHYEGGCSTKHTKIAAYLASRSWCKNGTTPNSE